MDEQKTQLIEKLKQATNILVTVSANPSVDQLSAAIGLTLFLNKLGKHASAVFSGKVPSTIQFLQPEKTIEKTTDSLRDFIIALDKSKADKLRYKVEDQMVKIFITPYQTSITDKDLEFSHGDFNVEAVVALGVKEQGELDQAITAHGNILHDAAVFGIGAGDPPVALGAANWNDIRASSLSEMITGLAIAINPEALDAQMATAMLTGIVAQTERFSNEKTSSETMQLSARLMAAGANQQLVASQLQQPTKPAPEKTEDAPKPEATDDHAELPEPKADAEDGEATPAKAEETKSETSSDGSLHITHGDVLAFGESTEDDKGPELDQIHIDENGELKPKDDGSGTGEKVLQPPSQDTSSRLMLEPPSSSPASEPPFGVTSATDETSGSDPLAGSGSAPGMPMLSHDQSTSASPKVVIQPPAPTPPIVAPVEAPVAPAPEVAPLDSLANLEKEVASAPAADAGATLDAAREAVNQAMGGGSSTPDPTSPTVEAAVTLPEDDPLNPPPEVITPTVMPNDPALPPGFSTEASPPPPEPIEVNSPIQVIDSNAPPPVPPPMMPPVNPPADGSPSGTAL